MTHSLSTSRLLLASAAAAVALILMMIGAGQARAQSEVTGTLTSGATATNTRSGTVVSGSTAQCSDGIDNDGDGLVDVAQDSGCDDASDNDETNNGGGGGGGGSRNSSNNDDDDGEVAGEQTGPTEGVGGSGDVLVPGVPNTGAGGNSAATAALLIGSLAVFAAGATAWRRYSI